MVRRIFNSCRNFRHDFLEIVSDYFSPRLAILKYPVRKL